MPEHANPTGAGYWYDQSPSTAGGVDVLNALRAYRAAEAAMRRRTRDSMRMNETDLLAIRYVMQARQAGKSIGPKDLSRVLNISTASTTALIDRLQKGGYLTRRPHPTDRRALEIIPTENADLEVRDTLGAMHRKMLDTAEALTPEEAGTITRFLREMAHVLDADE
ncbi:MarR family winged helix-turn-helix transcriptional regulator [Arthrobacter koreensis]|uniref:MarR family winged helix-turn-helix transcriptional regulator n=1 Tax=Arthrobacter koreensis TaxID=199136 RepID=UPI002DB9185B|nr:MarR family transcriptional regulator [Arthrobacter koreensis]MEB7446814.1 MarR family transcriptional regulator [Arthrobacter koreensis]